MAASVICYLLILRDKVLEPLDPPLWFVRWRYKALRASPGTQEVLWSTSCQYKQAPARECYPGPAWKTAEQDGNEI